MKKVIIYVRKALVMMAKQFGRVVNRKPSAVAAGKSAAKEANLLVRVEAFLDEAYEFRFNCVNEVTEYRRKSGGDPFRPLGQRDLNTLCLETHKAVGNSWDRDVSRYIHSLHVPSYHPFDQYFKELPAWDGVDRVEALARRVSDDGLWVRSFRRWLLGMVAQWTGRDTLHANSVAPVLVSRRQGRHKSTFCKMLVPPSLQSYYTDSFDLTSTAGAEQKLTFFGLINLDEMDKFTPRKMALLKNLMQMAELNIRKAYQKTYRALPRVASFMATSNEMGLLTDPTGSRRFLCVEVTRKIDCSPIDHAQVYAQLKAELDGGERYWFTSEEETEIMAANAPFRRHQVEEDVFLSSFRRPVDGETPLLLSAAHIFERMKKKNPAAMRSISAIHFPRILTALGIEKVHTVEGNRYKVVACDREG